MKNYEIADGVWPTMLTPFTESGKVDYPVLEKMIEWYIERGVQGLFAVCQSSEMFYLSLEERIDIARFVVKTVNNRVQVIASGHVSDKADEQIYEIQGIADAGVDAVVVVSNRLADITQLDDVWKRSAEGIMNKVDTPLGIYECPYPYKRLMTPELLNWCASTERFLFLKDTCCDTKQIEEKINAVQGTNLKIFNANAATLLDSLKIGVKGYSGVMANFHPEFYVWLCDNWSTQPELAQVIQDVLGLASTIEYQYYPVNAKYHMQLEGINMQLKSRVKDEVELTFSKKLEVEQLKAVIEQYRKKIKL